MERIRVVFFFSWLNSPSTFSEVFCRKMNNSWFLLAQQKNNRDIGPHAQDASHRQDDMTLSVGNPES